MNIRFEEHFVEKPTQWGVVKRSLNQHIVYVNDMEAGIVGKTAFMPRVGFPREWVDAVAQAATKELGRLIVGTEPPPSMAQLAVILEGAGVTSGED